MTHDTRTIGKIAVYDMAIILLLISCMTAQIIMGIILSAFKRSNTETHVFYIVTVSQ